MLATAAVEALDATAAVSVVDNREVSLEEAIKEAVLGVAKEAALVAAKEAVLMEVAAADDTKDKAVSEVETKVVLVEAEAIKVEVVWGAAEVAVSVVVGDSKVVEAALVEVMVGIQEAIMATKCYLRPNQIFHIINKYISYCEISFHYEYAT